jgi:hypothetical protein
MNRKFKRVTLCAAVIGVLYFSLFDTTPQGTECHKSTSPNGAYSAERCLLHWHPGSNSDYVARVFDVKTGKKLAQRSFSTTDPEISWFSYDKVYVLFSMGGDDEVALVMLPPSKWDKLLAARPRL